MDAPLSPKPVGLPTRPFLYTVDQLSVLLSVSEKDLRETKLWYEGREVGARPKHKMKAINIADPDDRPDWRVSEQELIRWMRYHRLKYYERGWVR